MKHFLLSLVLVLLVGCSQTIKVVRVPVPVAPPQPVIPERPVLETVNATPAMDDDVFIKALELDFAKLIKYTGQLERILEVYSKEATEKFMKELQTDIKIE